MCYMQNWPLVAAYVPIEMVSILSEDVNEAIIVGLAPGEVDGGGVKVLLEQRLQLGFGVVLVQTDHLSTRNKEGSPGWPKFHQRREGSFPSNSSKLWPTSHTK